MTVDPWEKYEQQGIRVGEAWQVVFESFGLLAKEIEKRREPHILLDTAYKFEDAFRRFMPEVQKFDYFWHDNIDALLDAVRSERERNEET